MIGSVFVIRHQLNLESEVLDTPDLLQKRDACLRQYRASSQYLDLEKRTEILNRRLDMLKQLLEMLQGRLEQSHSIKLEWIVIFLIIVSIFIEVILCGGKVLGVWRREK